MSVTSANRDLQLLHPVVREKVLAVLAETERRQLPFRVFEAFRSPERQNYLYAQGRTRPGPIVTYVKAWHSYHQYGLAVDFVGYGPSGWDWDLPDAMWTELHQIGASVGLERLGFETPHLQLAKLSTAALLDGDWPDGGDQSWTDNLTAAIAGWRDDPPAPPLPATEERPALKTFHNPVATLGWANAPAPAVIDWRDFAGGRRWRCDGTGVTIDTAPDQPQRTPGAPRTCMRILELYGKAILDVSLRYKIPPELIIMTIATESADARETDFTGPLSFRWEPHVPVNDVTPPTLGDYSAGPMQTLATTARENIRKMKLSYTPFTVAPAYPVQPVPAPTDNPLYGGDVNIDLGTAEIESRRALTGLDPILVAAAFNAGGLYQSDRNAWHLRSYGDHLDRAAAWYGDACFVMATLR